MPEFPKDPPPDLEDFLENTLKYCPEPNDNICVKFKTELEEHGIECNGHRAARLKNHLQWKCENGPTKGKRGSRELRGNEKDDKLYPEHDVLPGYVRPHSYEIWLWVHKEPIIKGNITINITVHG